MYFRDKRTSLLKYMVCLSVHSQLLLLWWLMVTEYSFNSCSDYTMIIASALMIDIYVLKTVASFVYIWGFLHFFCVCDGFFSVLWRGRCAFETIECWLNVIELLQWPATRSRLRHYLIAAAIDAWFVISFRWLFAFNLPLLPVTLKACVNVGGLRERILIRMHLSVCWNHTVHSTRSQGNIIFLGPFFPCSCYNCLDRIHQGPQGIQTFLHNWTTKYDFIYLRSSFIKDYSLFVNSGAAVQG